MIFALHPVQVEAVGWVAGMKDLLAGFWDAGAADLSAGGREPAKNLQS